MRQLFTGNIVVQLISILLSPIIARLYSPEEMGVYQSISTYVLIVSPFVGMSFSQIIIKCESNIERLKLCNMAFMLITVSSLIFVVISYILAENEYLKIKIELNHYVLIGVMLHVGGWVTVLQAYALSESRYECIAKSNVIQSLVGSFSKVILGYTWLNNSISLLCAVAMGGIAGALGLIDKKQITGKFLYSWKDVYYLIIKEKDISIYYTLITFIMILSNWMLVMISPFMADAREVGFMTLALMITKTPMHPFLSSITKYCYSEAGRASLKNKNKLIIRISLYGSLIPIVSLLMFWLFGELIVAFIFGSNWTGVTKYAFWFLVVSIPTFAMQPAIETFSNLKNVNNRIIYIEILLIVISIFVAYYMIKNDYELIDYIKYSTFATFLSLFVKMLLVSKFSNEE